MRVQVVPDGNGIVSVRHFLGTQELDVRCLLADGSGVGYLLATCIDDDSVEVATVPGSGVVAVDIEPFAAGETPVRPIQSR